jgi:hypothetical protein
VPSVVSSIGVDWPNAPKILRPKAARGVFLIGEYHMNQIVLDARARHFMALANAEFINLQARELLQERQQYHQEVCCASFLEK